MKTLKLLDQELVFGDNGPYTQQLLSNQLGKVVRYTLKPGQELDETHAPFMPRYFLVIKGRGMFISEDGDEATCGPDSLIVFDPREENTIRALDEDLVVLGFLFWPTAG